MRFVDRLLCWLIRRKLDGRDVVMQHAGADVDVAKFSSVYPVVGPGEHRFVVVLSKTVSADTKLGFEVKQYPVDVLAIRWRKDRKQFVTEV